MLRRILRQSRQSVSQSPSLPVERKPSAKLSPTRPVSGKPPECIPGLPCFFHLCLDCPSKRVAESRWLWLSWPAVMVLLRLPCWPRTLCSLCERRNAVWPGPQQFFQVSGLMPNAFRVFLNVVETFLLLLLFWPLRESFLCCSLL